MNKLIVIVLLALIAYAFFTAVDVFAGTDNTVSICDTVDANSTAAYNGHNVDSLDANSRHCVAEQTQEQIDTVSSDRHQEETSEQPVVVPAPIVDVPVVTDDNNTPIVNDTPATNEQPIVTDKKQACNNGEGNGSEGCSPAKSDNANNDENGTTPKQDKSNK